jgi:Effector-associated domain 8
MKLTDEERDELCLVIARLDVFIDEDIRGRRILLQDAHLERFLGMKLSGDAEIVAKDLVTKLERYGYLVPEWPTYHALGALLVSLLKRPDLPQDQATFLARLIVRHSLVLDTVYIDSLRVKYSITGTSLPPVVLAQPISIHTQAPNKDADVEQSPMSLSGEGFEEERNSLIKQLRQWKSNQRYLEEQASLHGVAVPLSLHNELEEAKRQIAILEERIANLPDSNRSNA